MSFQQGLSGLNAAAKGLDVVSNNIANSATVGFKASSAHFADVYANSLSGAGASQVGIGTSTMAIQQSYTQGNVTTTNNPLDIAVNGGGFYRMSLGGTVTFSRNGQFHLDKSGYIVDDRSRVLTGYPADAAGNVVQSSPIDLQLDSGDQPPVATGAGLGTFQGVRANVNLDSRSGTKTWVPALATDSVWSPDPASYNWSTALSIYDSLGNAHTLSLYAVRQVPTAISAATAADVAADTALATATTNDTAATATLAASAAAEAITAAALVTATNDDTAALAALATATTSGDPVAIAAATAAQAITAAALATATTNQTAAAATLATDTAAKAATAAALTAATTAKATTAAALAAANATTHPSQWDIHANVDGTNDANVTLTGGTLTFDTSGNLTGTGIVNASIDLLGVTTDLGQVNSATTPLTFEIDFTGSSQYGSAFGANRLEQDGYTSGRLTGVSVAADGVIRGNYSNGQARNLGQVVLAGFTNPNGLTSLGGNQWAETSASGAALVGAPGSASLGVLQSAAIEESNTDLTAELVNMITQQRNYQANAQSIKTQDQILQTLVNLR